MLSTKESSLRLRSLRIGPGELEREFWEERSPIRRSTAATRDAPQISQFRSDGLFSNVQRGQRNFVSSASSEAIDTFPSSCVLEGPICRFDMAAIADLTKWTSGGLMPQARHGGSWVYDFAVAGSKLDGIGLENEQIGHTQVALGDMVGDGV